MAIIEYKDVCIGVMVERVNEVLEITPDKIVTISTETSMESEGNSENAEETEKLKETKKEIDENLSDEDKALAEFVKATADLEEYSCSIIDIDKLIAIRK